MPWRLPAVLSVREFTYLDLQAGVLRNRLGITDKAELAQAEAELTGYRLIELQLSQVGAPSGRG